VILRRTPREVYRVCTEEELFAEESPSFFEEPPTAELPLVTVPARSRARLMGATVLTVVIVVVSAIIVHTLRRPERRPAPLAELPAEVRLPRFPGSSARPATRIFPRPHASPRHVSRPRRSHPSSSSSSSSSARQSVHSDPVFTASATPVVRAEPPAPVGFEFGFER
jgi:hypothetical protein